jgi:hypothetical protein
MFRVRAASLLLAILFLCSLSSAKDDPTLVLFWPSQDNASLKISFARFRSLGPGFEGKSSWVSDVIIQNVSAKAIPQGSLSVYMLDKERVRVGDGLLVFNDVNPGETIKVLFQCTSVGIPTTLTIAGKNSGGVPTSLKTIPLQVISVPAGASLKIDGKDEGVTPATVNLTAGNHTLELQKEGYGLTTTPLDIAPNEAAGGSIKISLAGLANDVVQMRDGSNLSGDVLTMTLDSIVIRMNGEDKKLDRNQVSKIFLVERTVTHTEGIPEPASGKSQPANNSTAPHR